MGSNIAAYLDQLWVSNIVKTKVINTLWFKLPLYSSTCLCKVVLSQNYYRNSVGQSSFISFATSRPVARNFNWVVLLYKIVDLFNKILDLLAKLWTFFNKIVDFLTNLICGFFKQNSGPFWQIFGFLKQKVDLFGKIVGLLFERGVLPHLENPPWLRA